jgi:Flp pilus assembly protein TadD
MRWLKSAAMVAISVVLLCDPTLLQAQQGISGRLIFDSLDFTCDSHCTVTLLSGGVRPVETVVTGIGASFSFSPVPRGSYSIRVEVPGFEPTTHPLETSGGGGNVNVLVPLSRPHAVVPSNRADVVNISEFLERYPKKAVSFFEKGSDSLRKNHNSDAVKYLRNAVELAPTFYEARNQLGAAYMQAGRFEDAEREFVLAHELNSTAVEPLLNLIAIYLDQDKPEMAVDAGEQAVKTNSRSAPAFFSLGVALYKAAQLDKAETALKRALDLAPKMGKIRLMLANVYLKLRQFDSTMVQLNAYIAENPKGEQIEAARGMRDKLRVAAETGQP